MNPHKTHTPLGTLNLRSLESGLAEMLLLIPKWNEEKAKPVVSSGYAEEVRQTLSETSGKFVLASESVFSDSCWLCLSRFALSSDLLKCLGWS